MKPDVVVDVGNSRIKWGRCACGAVGQVMSLADDPAAWQVLLERWSAGAPLTWVLSGVHPDRRDRLADWLRQHSQQVHLLQSASELPLVTALEHPDRVGIDRLLNAVAVNRRRDAGQPAVVVSAGTAIVVDWVDAYGVFHGGAIFPGLHLMARALHEHTALLPLIDPPTAPPPLPGRTTPAAMAAGIFWAAAGGIRALTDEFAAGQKAHLFLTGGDAPALRSALDPEAVLWPAMTLEGVRLAAEALP